MTITIHDFDVEDMRNCIRIVEMFDDFDSAWPGGFNRGLPSNVIQMQRHYRQGRYLAVLVAEEAGEYIGYCTLEAKAGQREIAYIGLLGARLSAHGKGVGKALLREMVRRSTDLGFRQVTLHTWAGNLKAVPLYKKTGFNWVPETDVFMRNFLPSALRLPLVKEFLADRDWYDCLDREIQVAPDENRWNGMKVYPYRFRVGDRTITLYYEETGQGLTAIETDDFSVACYVPEEDPPAGVYTPIFWEMASKSAATPRVAVLAQGEPGLDVDLHEHFTLDRDIKIERCVAIGVDLSPRGEYEASHRVRSNILFGDHEVLLETGVHLVRPVEMELTGDTGKRLRPGIATRLTVRLRNRVNCPFEGTVSLLAVPDQLAVSEKLKSVTIPAKGWTEVGFNVTAVYDGALPVTLRLCEMVADGLTIERPIILHVHGGGGAVGSYDAYTEVAEIDTPDLRASISSRGGRLTLSTGGGKACLSLDMAVVGPPFPGEILLHEPVDVQVQSGPDGDKLVCRARADRNPGLMVERVVTLLGGGLVQLKHRVVNLTNRPATTKLFLHSSASLEEFVTVPMAVGVVRQSLRGLHSRNWGGTDLLAPGTDLTENWIACEDGGVVGGLAFGGRPEQDREWTKLINLTYDLQDIPPSGSVEIPVMYAIASSGTWETVRKQWRSLMAQAGASDTSETSAECEVVPIFDIKCSPALFSGLESKLGLIVANHHRTPLSGTVNLSGWGVAIPDSVTIAEIRQGLIANISTDLTVAELRTAGVMTAKFDSHPTGYEVKVPMVCLGARGDVRVEHQSNGALVVDNGLLNFVVVPDFNGGLVSLEQDAMNHLRTAYPETVPFRWANPWHGGLHPFVEWMGAPRLTREKFTGEPIEIAGQGGIRWQGVRVTCSPKHKDLNWLKFDVDYLTTAESNVLALVVRCTNQTNARMELTGDLGLAAWLQVGGSHVNNTVHAAFAGERQIRRRGMFDVDSYVGNWKAVENPETGHYVLMVAGRDAKAGLEDFDVEGAHLTLQQSVALKPGETKIYPGWLVLGKDMSQLDAYVAALSKVREL